MYGYIYLTTNLINGKKYIGKHVSENFIGTKYLGSGAIIQKAIKKYGIKSFKVEMLESVNDKDKLNERERYWISFYDAVNSDNFYNILPGGDGGSAKGQPKSDKFKKTMSDIQKNGKSWMNGKHHSEETKRKMSESQSGNKHPMYGKHHKDESKIKMREAKLRNLPSICGSGEANPMTGRIWITDGITSKAINPDELSHYETLGYKKGRTIKSRRATTIENLSVN